MMNKTVYDSKVFKNKLIDSVQRTQLKNGFFEVNNIIIGNNLLFRQFRRV